MGANANLRAAAADLDGLKALGAKIQTQQTIHTHVEVIGKLIKGNAVLEQGANGSLKCQLLLVAPSVDAAAQAAAQAQIQQAASQTLNLTSVDVVAGPHRDLSKFSFSDASGIRKVEWYDQATGFLVQSALLDDKHDLLTFDRYTNITLNLQASTSYPCMRPPITRGDLLLEKKGASLDEQVAELEDYCDIETNYNLRTGLAQDLRNSGVTLQPLRSSVLVVSPTPFPAMTLPPTATLVSEPTAVVTMTPTTSPTETATAWPTLTQTPAATVEQIAVPTQTTTSTIEPTLPPTPSPEMTVTPGATVGAGQP